MPISVSKEQLNQLSDTTMAKKVEDVLRLEFKEGIEAIAPTELRQVVLEQIQVARKYGLTTELNVANFVVTAWVLGLEFDTNIPAANECLTNAEMTQDDKAVWLEQFTNVMLTKLAEG